MPLFVLRPWKQVCLSLLAFVACVGLLSGCGGGAADPGASMGTGMGTGTASLSPAPATSSTPPPLAPTDPSTPATGEATLSWNPPPTPVAGYRIYHGSASRDYRQARGQGIATSATRHTLSALPANGTTYFAVTSVDAAGLESPYSLEVTKTFP